MLTSIISSMNSGSRWYQCRMQMRSWRTALPSWMWPLPLAEAGWMALDVKMAFDLSFYTYNVYIDMTSYIWYYILRETKGIACISTILGLVFVIHVCKNCLSMGTSDWKITLTGHAWRRFFKICRTRADIAVNRWTIVKARLFQNWGCTLYTVILVGTRHLQQEPQQFDTGSPSRLPKKK